MVLGMKGHNHDVGAAKDPLERAAAVASIGRARRHPGNHRRSQALQAARDSGRI